MGDSINYCDQCENQVGCHLARQCFHANDKATGPLDAAACSGRVGAEIGTDDAWPANLMCRLLLPVPVKELAAIGDALAKIAKKQGKEARMKQVGQTLEIFTVQNASNQTPPPRA